ncbi:ATPase subunit 4 [Cucumis melo var. makuwa]|uniref:ATP synthase protein MI25 n=1 Tax=Cucumis melo var. makuwa TaxID=1194695 RepID=A0A5A7T1A4_CUCMM|nr:ATPase subunit 4 [Cucumis melo var. makuwa]
MNSNDFSKSSRTDYYSESSDYVSRVESKGEAVSGDSPAESRMRGDLHVRFGGRGYPDPTIIMPLQSYLTVLERKRKKGNFKTHKCSFSFILSLELLYSLIPSSYQLLSFPLGGISAKLQDGLGQGLSRWASASDSQARKMLFAAILSICALSSKKISIYNEEMIVASSFIGFLILSRKNLGKTFKATFDGRIQAIQEESQQFPNPNEVVPEESNEQQRLLRISLRICGTVVESLPMARYAPKCEKTVQALLCRNLNVKSATLPNATSSRRIRLQDDLVTGFHFSVSERFVPGCTLKASIVELIREGLVVLRMVRVGGSLKKKSDK